MLVPCPGRPDERIDRYDARCVRAGGGSVLTRARRATLDHVPDVLPKRGPVDTVAAELEGETSAVLQTAGLDGATRTVLLNYERFRAIVEA
jgi:hypothetical protein